VFAYTEELRDRALRNSGNLVSQLADKKVPIPGRKRNYNYNTIDEETALQIIFYKLSARGKYVYAPAVLAAYQLCRVKNISKKF